MPSYPADAACAHSGLPPATWDDEIDGETEQQKTARIKTAKRICGQCPVADKCHARRYEGGGVRAGKLHPDRVPGYTGDLYAGLPPEPQPTGCGTRNGYMTHVRAREVACADCKAAHSRYMVERHQARRAEKVA